MDLFEALDKLYLISAVRPLSTYRASPVGASWRPIQGLEADGGSLIGTAVRKPHTAPLPPLSVWRSQAAPFSVRSSQAVPVSVRSSQAAPVSVRSPEAGLRLPDDLLHLAPESAASADVPVSAVARPGPRALGVGLRRTRGISTGVIYTYLLQSRAGYEGLQRTA